MTERGSDDELEARLDKLMQREEWLLAINLGRSARHPSGSILWSIGWAYCKVGEFAVACRYLRRAIRADSRSAESHFALGYALYEMGKFRLAEVSLLRAVALGSRRLAAGCLGLLYMKQGRWDEAESVHRARIASSPSKDAMETFADFLSDIGEEVEAQQWYERAKQAPEILTRVAGSELWKS